jgi:phage baseplate assembly protein W
MATPHLSWPLRLANTGHLATVEQDSVDDVAECVEVVLRTRPGELDFHPRFGSPDLAFREMQSQDGLPSPISPDGLVALIEAWEARGALLVQNNPDALEPTLGRLNIYVSED